MDCIVKIPRFLCSQSTNTRCRPSLEFVTLNAWSRHVGRWMSLHNTRQYLRSSALIYDYNPGFTKVVQKSIL